jgi:hypothetical protein
MLLLRIILRKMPSLPIKWGLLTYSSVLFRRIFSAIGAFHSMRLWRTMNGDYLKTWAKKIVLPVVLLALFFLYAFSALA